MQNIEICAIENKNIFQFKILRSAMEEAYKKISPINVLPERGIVEMKTFC